MTFNELTVLLPFLILAITAVLTLLSIAFNRQHILAAGLTWIGLVFAGLTLLVETAVLPQQVTPLLIVGDLARFYLGLILAAALAVAVLAFNYLSKQAEQREEFYVLLLLATLGAMILVASSHFAAFFLGLELLSVSLVGLIAYLRARPFTLAAGFKYLVLAAVSVSFTLFGIALIYASQGHLAFADLDYAQLGTDALSLTGLALLVIGVGFKLALVPFHMWVPDVYDGAPAPVTAFVATVSKTAVFAFLIRFFSPLSFQESPALLWGFALIAVASMFGGNWLALRERNVKRILAYSSIAHLGYLLVAFLASGAAAMAAATFYLTAYVITTLGAFGVVSVLSGAERDADSLDDFRGLFWQRPWLAAIMTTALFSLAGIPLTAGFVGKFFVLAASVGALSWLLPLALVVSSAIGLYYYLNLIVTMFREPQTDQLAAVPAPTLSVTGSLVLAALLLLLVWFGVYPAPLLRMIQTAVAGLS